VKNATKVVQALVALHKALGDSWSTEIRNGTFSKEGPSVTFQAENERAHRKLASYFGLTSTWLANRDGRTESLHSEGVVDGVAVLVFAPSRSVKQQLPSDLKRTPALVAALAKADEAVRP
jgi:hypothetical protein